MLNNRILTSSKLNTPVHEIVKGCIDNNRAAQEHLYRLYSAKMFGVCLRYSKNKDEAKDILQDGFMKVFDKIHQFKNTGSLEGWIRKIMVNTALENYRKKSNISLMDHIPEVKDEPEEQWESEIPLDELNKMIQNLPERYRMVFNLYVFEDMQHKEIGKLLGITEGTSKSDLSRARNILKQKVNTYYKKKLAQIG